MRDSQYLKHIGKHLHPNIDVMWTGMSTVFGDFAVVAAGDSVGAQVLSPATQEGLVNFVGQIM